MKYNNCIVDTLYVSNTQQKFVQINVVFIVRSFLVPSVIYTILLNFDPLIHTVQS